MTSIGTFDSEIVTLANKIKGHGEHFCVCVVDPQNRYFQERYWIETDPISIDLSAPTLLELQQKLKIFEDEGGFKIGQIQHKLPVPAEYNAKTMCKIPVTVKEETVHPDGRREYTAIYQVLDLKDSKDPNSLVPALRSPDLTRVGDAYYDFTNVKYIVISKFLFSSERYTYDKPLKVSELQVYPIFIDVIDPNVPVTFKWALRKDRFLEK